MNASVAGQVRLYDRQPALADFRQTVLDGLSRRPRAIPPKFFYDAEGSCLFDAICECPEYYPTRTEKALLARHAEAIAERVGPACLLIEPGSGSSEKVRLLLDTLRPAAYLPMDISRHYLFETARNLGREYPWLAIHATCIDFTRPISLPFAPPNVRRVAFFPGSSIGNFDPDDARTFLRHLVKTVGPGGGLLIGVDCKKDRRRLETAYNDAAGITARFNLHLLERINAELDGDFDLDGFRHHAFYNAKAGRIEMHLVSRKAQTVHIGKTRFDFAAEESIHTENSYKYHVAEFAALAQSAGFILQQVWQDDEGLFSLQYYEVES